MKRMMVALAALMALMFSAGAMAGAYYQKGFVYASSTYLYGTMSVRFNTDSTTYQPYIYANGGANSSVFFAGQGGDGTYFSCYVPTSSALYAAAVDIKNSFHNGSYIYVTKGTSSSECTSVQHVTASYWLN